MADDACIVCRLRKPRRGYVCDGDRTSLREMLADLPRQMSALALQVVPGAAGPGEKVTTTRVGSPSPARMDALSLLAPGNERVTAMVHPLIRRWHTEENVYVTVVAAPGQPRIEQRTITVWQQELARDATGRVIEVADDDQIGVIPPAEWLDATVRAWRRHFGHHVPTRTHYRPPVSPESRHERLRQIRRLFTDLRGYAGANVALSYIAMTEAAWHNYTSGRALGMYPGHGTRIEDPLADEWEVRFGEPPRYAAPAADIKYLLTWLDEACDQNVDVVDFAAQLRALNAEMTRVLGEQPDQQWIGRCPATITVNAGTDSETQKTCGAGLWQDPYVQQVLCPRCHSAWGPREIELLMLAKEIRRVWPIDRRRRYDHAAREAVQHDRPRCPDCSCTVVVKWREVTEPSDKTRWWRPEKTICPMGCAEAEKIL